MIIRKTQSYQQKGEYKPTSIDQAKQEADFRLMQVSPYYIRWKDGKGEIVSSRQLKKLQKEHPNWMPDF